MSWHSLVGTPGYLSGTSGTVTVPAGASVVQILVHSSTFPGGGTMTIFGGTSIPIVANTTGMLEFRYFHTLIQAINNSRIAGSQDIVFTNTDSYYVEYVKAGNT